MKPTSPQEIYKITAKRLNLPEEYVKDAVEYFYQTTKDEMGKLSSVLFCLRGLGRFVIRPLKFFRKQEKMMELVERFGARRDDRGLMIKRELLKRYDQFQEVRPVVEEYNEKKRKKIFKNAK